jgi:Spy/CpxP family protein refolding chaperone
MLLALVAGATVRIGAQTIPPHRGKWWQSEDVQRQLGLTPAQVDAIEKVWRQDLAERIRLRQDLDALEAQWTDALQRGAIDDEDAEKLIDRVENARMKRNKARTVVLLEMYRVLTPEQRSDLRDLQGLPGSR